MQYRMPETKACWRLMFLVHCITEKCVQGHCIPGIMYPWNWNKGSLELSTIGTMCPWNVASMYETLGA
jgi:hypothetical protein